MKTSWAKVSLGDVVRDLTPQRTFEVAELDTVIDPTIRSAAHTITEAASSLGSQVRVRKRIRLHPGDLVFSRLHTQNGAFAYSEGTFQATGTFIPLEVNEGKVDRRFLFWVLHVFVPTLSASDTVGRETFKTDEILALQIPLPPLSEQRWLVARVESLRAQVEEAKALRGKAAEETEALLTTARFAVLSACDGEMVELQDACEAVIDNLHSNPHLCDTGVPCIRSSDVGYGTLNLDGAQRTDEDEFRRRTVRGEPRAGDIVLVREGGGTGKCAVVQQNHRFSLGQRVMMLRPDTSRILPRFFLHQLLSPQVQQYQMAPLCKGSASPHLNIAALRRFNLVVPPLSEQRRIVGELDALEAEVNKLGSLQAKTAAELDALLPAILDRALKGNFDAGGASYRRPEVPDTLQEE
jgi:type I restriction enzyme S subunit